MASNRADKHLITVLLRVGEFWHCSWALLLLLLLLLLLRSAMACGSRVGMIFILFYYLDNLFLCVLSV